MSDDDVIFASDFCTITRKGADGKPNITYKGRVFDTGPACLSERVKKSYNSGITGMTGTITEGEDKEIRDAQLSTYQLVYGSGPEKAQAFTKSKDKRNRFLRKSMSEMIQIRKSLPDLTPRLISQLTGFMKSSNWSEEDMEVDWRNLAAYVEFLVKGERGNTALATQHVPQTQFAWEVIEGEREPDYEDLFWNASAEQNFFDFETTSFPASGGFSPNSAFDSVKREGGHGHGAFGSR